MVQFEPFLLAQLENTVFSDDSDSGAPLCFPKEGTTLLTALSEVTCSQDLLPPAQERGEGVAWQQLERVLQLLVVLWGDLPDMTSPGKERFYHTVGQAGKQTIRLGIPMGGIWGVFVSGGHTLMVSFRVFS